MTYAEWVKLTWIWGRPEWQQMSIDGQISFKKLHRQDRRFARLCRLWRVLA